MQTLIIADNIRQAEFIQKGFQYENLSADIWQIEKCVELIKYIPFYDGIFILSDCPARIMSVISSCKDVKKNIPFFCLTQKYNGNLAKLMDEKHIDFLFVRPFSFRNIASEMRFSIFQEKENLEHSQYVLRDLELNLLSHEVKHKDIIINLRNKEFGLLHFMMVNVGRVLSRTTILENVWDRNANIMTNTVDVHISQLRKKIENNTEQKYIHTIPCTGYILS